jgi:hypothetical protein
MMRCGSPQSNVEMRLTDRGIFGRPPAVPGSRKRRRCAFSAIRLRSLTQIRHPSPEAVGPGSRLRRRYDADPPAAAFFNRSRGWWTVSAALPPVRPCFVVARAHNISSRTPSCTAALRWYQGQALRALRGLDTAGRRRAIERAGSGEKCRSCLTREKGGGGVCPRSAMLYSSGHGSEACPAGLAERATSRGRPPDAMK